MRGVIFVWVYTLSFRKILPVTPLKVYPFRIRILRCLFHIGWPIIYHPELSRCIKHLLIGGSGPRLFRDSNSVFGANLVAAAACWYFAKRISFLQFWTFKGSLISFSSIFHFNKWSIAFGYAHKDQWRSGSSSTNLNFRLCSALCRYLHKAIATHDLNNIGGGTP